MSDCLLWIDLELVDPDVAVLVGWSAHPEDADGLRNLRGGHGEGHRAAELCVAAHRTTGGRDPGAVAEHLHVEVPDRVALAGVDDHPVERPRRAEVEPDPLGVV